MDVVISSEETIAKSLVGNYRDEHLFALRQAVELYETYQNKITDCEAAIIAQINSYPDATDDEPPPPAKQSNASARVRAGVDVREALFKKSGVDLLPFRVWVPILCLPLPARSAST